MHRTLVQLEEPLYQELKRRAFEMGISLSALVRNLLSRAVRGNEKKVRRRIDQFKFIGMGRSKERDIAVNHDKYLAEDYLK